MSKRVENEERSSLLSSVGRLFGKLLNEVKNKLIDFLAVDPMPMEFSNIEKNAAKTQKNKPVGLFSLLRVFGKTTGFLLKSSWKYVVKPVFLNPIEDIVRAHKPDNYPDFDKNTKKYLDSKENRVTVCPKVRLENGNGISSMNTHHPRAGFKSGKDIIVQREARLKRENYKVTYRYKRGF